MAHYTADELLRHVGELLGLPDLAFDDDALCGLKIDESIELILLRAPHHVEISTDVCHFPGDVASVELLRDIAKANYMWTGTGGATLGVNELSHTVVLAERFSVGAPTPTEFAQQLEGFVKIALFWKDRLAHTPSASATASVTPTAAKDESESGLHNLLHRI